MVSDLDLARAIERSTNLKKIFSLLVNLVKNQRIILQQIENSQVVTTLNFEEIMGEYFEITFIRGTGVPIFLVFVGRLIHEIKNPTNNETWKAV